MAESSNLISKDLFDVMKQEQLKDYYNTFLKPRKLVKYEIEFIKNKFNYLLFKITIVVNNYNN